MHTRAHTHTHKHTHTHTHTQAHTHTHTHTDATINYSAQASFAVGILISEISTGVHPLPDYPLGYTVDEFINYKEDDLSPLPSSYPNSFCSIAQDLLTFDPAKRLSISEALNQLQVCCIRRNSIVTLSSDTTSLTRMRQERDLARVSIRPHLSLLYVHLGGNKDREKSTDFCVCSAGVHVLIRILAIIHVLECEIRSAYFAVINL